MSSAYTGNFTPPFHFGHLVCLFLLIDAARISNSMLNRSGESEHPCLFPDFPHMNFHGKPLAFHSLSIMALGFS